MTLQDRAQDRAQDTLSSTWGMGMHTYIQAWVVVDLQQTSCCSDTTWGTACTDVVAEHSNCDCLCIRAVLGPQLKNTLLPWGTGALNEVRNDWQDPLLLHAASVAAM